MKKVLYLTNIEVPYRVRFFNELSRYCDLTVVYERENSSNRNAAWTKSEHQQYKTKYLNGIKIRNENTFSLKILKELFAKYDHIIVGCCNSPMQMFAMLVMRMVGISYFLNLDGETFLSGSGIKAKLKRFFLSGAKKYLVAGEKAADSLRNAIGQQDSIPYYFSSLSEQEVEDHRNQSVNCERNDTILVVGQYFDYKGMDIALKTADMDHSLHYKFVGMGVRSEQFAKDHTVPDNVEIIPFLQKAELEKEYRKCAMLVLPSRQECWGLVVNEAASFGMPIVSTWGSGAAVEFLADDFPQYLAAPNDPESLYHCILRVKAAKDKDVYSAFLLKKSEEYSIERSAHIHAETLKG